MLLAIHLPLSAVISTQVANDWSAAFKQQNREYHNVAISATVGQLPSSLRGTLFKNGPARFSRGNDQYAHWLDGDGYVTALRISDAGVTWSGRYVRTDAFNEEEVAGKVTFRTTFGTEKAGGIASNAFDIRLKSPANTNILPASDGTILALWEAGPPYELCSQTLECRGASDLNGRLAISPAHGALPGTIGLEAIDRVLDGLGLLTDALSAHPRVDAHAHAQCTVAWSWRQELLGDAIEVKLHTLPTSSEHSKTAAAATASGSRPAVRAMLEKCAFAPHDMALSRSLAIFVTAPTRVDIAPFIFGLRGPAQCTTFDGAAVLGGDGSTLHCIRRDGAGVRRFAIPEAWHAVHMANAFERSSGSSRSSIGGGESSDASEDGELVVLASCWPPTEVRRMAATGRDLLGSWEDLQSGDFSDVPKTHLVRFVVDMPSGAVHSSEILAGFSQLDHPKVHPAYSARDHRFIYATCGVQGNLPPTPTQSFVVVDLETSGGEIVDTWNAGARRIVDEATLVARGEGEREAWLVAPVFDGETQRTSYVVLDAADLNAGPVCELALPTFVPWGLHGAWVDEAGGGEVEL